MSICRLVCILQLLAFTCFLNPSHLKKLLKFLNPVHFFRSKTSVCVVFILFIFYLALYQPSTVPCVSPAMSKLFKERWTLEIFDLLLNIQYSFWWNCFSMEHMKDCQTDLWLSSICWLLLLSQERLWWLGGTEYSKLWITGSKRSVCQYLYIILCEIEDFEYVVTVLPLPCRQNYSMYQESFLFAITISDRVTMVHCPILCCCCCWWLGHLRCATVSPSHWMAASVIHQLIVTVESGEWIQILKVSQVPELCVTASFGWGGNIFLTWKPTRMYIYDRILLNSSLN